MMLKMCSWLPLIHIMKPIMPTIFSGDVACEYSAYGDNMLAISLQCYASLSSTGWA